MKSLDFYEKLDEEIEYEGLEYIFDDYSDYEFDGDEELKRLFQTMCASRDSFLSLLDRRLNQAVYEAYDEEEVETLTVPEAIVTVELVSEAVDGIVEGVAAVAGAVGEVVAEGIGSVAEGIGSVAEGLAELLDF